MTKLSLLLSAAALALFAAPHSQAMMPASECNPVTVMFGNGIKTERVDALVSLKQMEVWLRPRIPALADKYVVFDVSKNPTDGILLDLVEVFEQKLFEFKALTWSMFFPFVNGKLVVKGLEALVENYLRVAGGSLMAGVAKRLFSSTIYTDAVVNGHVDKYRQALRAGHRVLIVSHSQGNLYANAAFNHLRAKNPAGVNLNALGIAAVGSPANVVATGDGYVTSSTDLVIQVVNGLGILGLPANDTSVPIFPAEDRLGHNFRDVYFNDKYAIRQHTQDVILASLNRLMGEKSTRPVKIDPEGLAVTAPYTGLQLTDQFANEGALFDGMKVYRNDGDPANPVTEFNIPMPPGKKGMIAGRIPTSEMRIASEFKIGRIRLTIAGSKTNVIATLASGKRAEFYVSGTGGGPLVISTASAEFGSCNPADRLENVVFDTSDGYILYELSLEAL